MEPEGSLQYAQMPATCPYPEPARSIPHPHIPLPEDPSYYPPIYVWVSQVVSFLQVSPPKPCRRLSSPPYALHAPPISFISILLPEQYWLLAILWTVFVIPAHAAVGGRWMKKTERADDQRCSQMLHLSELCAVLFCLFSNGDQNCDTARGSPLN